MAAADSTSREYATHFYATILEKLYLNEDYADFHFVFDSGERIPVHKNILGIASDAFRAMFGGLYIEKTETKIVDASADAFKEFLQFIYRPKANVTMTNAAEVMNLGKKYDITECFNICGEYLKENIRVDDVLWIYEVAEHLEHAELVENCEEYVKRNTKAIFESESFLNCDRKIVKWVLQMDWLACSEMEVFQALMKWVKAKCGQEVLTRDLVHGQFSDLVHELRFGSMSSDIFSTFVASYGALFTTAEYDEIMQMFNSKQFEPTIFKKNRRNHFGSIQWNIKTVIKCDRWIKHADVPYYIKNIETTTFTVNKMVLLGAFTCAYMYRYNNSFKNLGEELEPSEITIIEYPSLAKPSDSVVLYNAKMNLLGSDATTIVLAKPILIQPELTYQIQMKQAPPSNCCSRIEVKTEVKLHPDIMVQFHNDPYVGGQARGLIDELHFNRI